MKRSFIIALFVLLVPLEAFALQCFPEAEGFGTDTVGGRSGTPTIYRVTNTNDSGAGSLRQAVEASGARIIVFTTGGTIALASSLVVSNPNITIAGQTAPGGGITIRDADFRIETHDVVIRYLTFRRGSGGDNHALEIQDHQSTNVYNIVIDHCTFSWATDENFGTQYRVEDLTVSYCLSSEALDCSTHSKGCHSKGMMFAGTCWDNSCTDSGTQDISVHHNVIASFNERGPLVRVSGIADVVNNVVYNAANSMGMVVRYDLDSGDPDDTMQVNWVKNYFKYGPDSDQNDWEIREWDTDSAGDVEIYILDNLGPHRTSGAGAQNLVVWEASRTYIVGSRHTAPSITESAADTVFDELTLAGGAGNSAYVDCSGNWVNRRDTIDTRIMSEVRSGTDWVGTSGEIIDDESDAPEGGWITISAGTACTDTDTDGMPDAFENAAFGDLDQTATTDFDADGYIDIEEYINGYASAPDTLAPATSGHDPANSATSVSTTKDIVVHITDNGDGVDIDYINMEVEGTDYGCSGQATGFCTGAGTPAEYCTGTDTGNDSLTCSGTSADYTVTKSGNSFSSGQVINVEVDAQDLASTPNVMSQDVYSYTCAVAQTTSAVTGAGNVDIVSGSGNLGLEVRP